MRKLLCGFLVIVILVCGSQTVLYVLEDSKEYVNEYTSGYRTLMEHGVQSIPLYAGEGEIVYLNETFGVSFERLHTPEKEHVIGYIDLVAVHRFDKESQISDRVDKLLRIKIDLNYQITDDTCKVEILTVECLPSSDATDIYAADVSLPKQKEFDIDEQISGDVYIDFANFAVDFAKKMSIQYGITVTEKGDVVFSLHPVNA